MASLINFDKLLTAWHEAGMPDEPIGSVARDATAAIKRITAGHRALMANRDATRREIIERLVSGEIDFRTAVVEEYALATVGIEGRERLLSLYRAGADLARTQAHKKLAALGDRLITEHLAPAHAELVETVAKNAAAVEGIEDDATAIKAGGKVRDAWGRISDAEAKRKALTAVSSILRQERIVTPVPDDIDTVFLQYRYPDRRPPVVIGGRRQHPVRVLVALVESGAEPGIYTTAQAREYALAHEAALRAQGEPSRPVRRRSREESRARADLAETLITGGPGGTAA